MNHKRSTICGANQYSEVTGFFSKINETKMTAENVFNPDHTRMEGKHELKTKAKPSFRHFC